MLIIKRYGFATLSVLLAVLPALLLQHYKFHDVELPLLLFATAFTAWHFGAGPAVLSIVLSSLFFDYFFAPPLYAFNLTPADIPAVVVLVSFAVLITRFAAVRRRIEGELVQARDKLQVEVAERTQQASLLNLTHDTIFVRDMNDVITYWNRGAEELYGWPATEAVGKRSRDLLRTVLPKPIDDISAELLRNRTLGRRGQAHKSGRKRGGGVEPMVVAARQQNKPAAVLETNNDITDRKRREEEIRGLNQELEKRSRLSKPATKNWKRLPTPFPMTFVPLSAIWSGYAELLQKAPSPLDDKGQRYMRMISGIGKADGHPDRRPAGVFPHRTRRDAEDAVNLEQLVKEALSEVQPETNGRDIVWKIESFRCVMETVPCSGWCSSTCFQMR